jgi:serine phosphatase RsbU (regulator of sigma subunit)/integral membrane sensor domain MASE1
MRIGEGGFGAVKVAAVVFVCYAAGSTLSWAAFGATVGPAFFPPAGLTVAALLLSRPRMWPAILAATALAELLVDLRFGDSVSEAAGFAIANSVEPLVGASLTRFWCGGLPDLRQRRQLMLFIAGACLAGPVVGGLIGGANIAVRYGVPFPTAVLHWVAGDAIGVFVVGVPILLWPKQFHVIRSRPWETGVVLAIAATATVVVVRAEIPPAVLILPVLAWAALRLDMLGAALTGTVVAFAANMMTISGAGLFPALDAPATTKLDMAQLFIAVVVVTALLIAQEAAARTKAVQDRDVERRERMRLETLAQLAQQLSAALNPREIGDALVAHVLNESGAKALNLGLMTPDGRRVEWVAMAGYPPSVHTTYGGGVAIEDRTVATDAVRSGQPVFIRTPDEYEARYSAAKARLLHISGTQSVVGWPLKSADTSIGVLFMAWPELQAFDAAQSAYVSAVATVVSQALVRARIYEDEQARAAVLQSAVLPALSSVTPGLDVCATYEPADFAHGVGGDWYDVMALPDGRTYLAVGDVVGHGLPAVEDMAQLRAAGRTLAHLGLPPGPFLAELNGLTRDLSKGKFATMAIATFDPVAGSLSYCLAGHPPLLLRRRSGEVLRLSDARGPALGPVHDVGYAEATVGIESGDILVMYTDGLVERRGDGIEAGISRAQLEIGDWDLSADLGRCGRGLRESLAPPPRIDDVCLVVVRFGGDGVVCTNC